MRLFFQPTIGMFIVAAALVPSAHAQNSAAYLATYVEIMPNARRSSASRCSSNIAMRAPRKTAICAPRRLPRSTGPKLLCRRRSLAREGGARRPRPKHGHCKVPRQAQADRGSAGTTSASTPRRSTSRRARTRASPRRSGRPHPCRRDPGRQGRLHGGAQGDEHRYRGRRRAISATRCCSSRTAATTSPSSRHGSAARRSTPMRWRRIRAHFAKSSARLRARYTTSVFTRR